MFFKRYPILSRFLVFIVSPILIILTYLSLSIMESIPEKDIYLLEEDGSYIAEIKSDIHGITYIDASSDENAFYALGYAHAKDRMWQLELQRRVASGRLSELFGEITVSQDVWMRTMDFYENVNKTLDSQVLSSRDLKSLYAYSRGINTWLSEGNELPPEFIFYDIEPELWKIEDSLAWMKVFQMNLGGNLWQELEVSASRSILSDKQFNSLFGFSAPVIKTSLQIDALHELAESESHVRSTLNIGGQFVGSNAWVISGKYTTSGFPMLVNDPHLGLQTPPLFYAAKMSGKDLHVQGMTLVGLPIMIFGKNRDIAWGGTSMEADVQDLFAEKINPSNPNQYWNKDEWSDFETHKELIYIATPSPSFLNNEPEPKQITVRNTVRGPVISDVVQYSSLGPLSLSWTALNQPDRSYSSFLSANYAKNWDDFVSAFDGYVAPALNLFYVDDRNIGQLGVGKIPIRKNNDGRFIQSGWLNEDWLGEVPYAEMPRHYNPDIGYLANANNEVLVGGGKYYVSSAFAANDRYKRITELLSNLTIKNSSVSEDDFKTMLTDTVSYEGEVARTIIKDVDCSINTSCPAYKALFGWDGRFDKSSVGASIYSVYIDELKTELLSDTLNADWDRDRDQQFYEQVISKVNYESVLRLLTEDSTIWCKNQGCTLEKQNAWNNAVKRLIKLKGSDVNEWKWGTLNQTVFKHTPFSQTKWSSKIFENRTSGEGGINTINVSQSQYDKEDGFHRVHSAAFRQIMSVGSDVDNHFFILPPGQSGHALSPNFDDALESYTNGDMWVFCLSGNTSPSSCSNN